MSTEEKVNFYDYFGVHIPSPALIYAKSPLALVMAVHTV
jgi:hypothetical protein